MSAHIYLYGLDHDTFDRAEEILSHFKTPYVEADTLTDLVTRLQPGDMIMVGWDEAHMEEVDRLLEMRPDVHVLFMSPTLGEGISPRAPMVGAFMDAPGTNDSIAGVLRGGPSDPEMDSTDDLLTLMELGRLLTSTLDLEDLYDQIIDQVQSAFRPNTVSLMLLTADNSRLRIVAQRGLSSRIRAGDEVPVDDSIAGRVVTEGKPQVLLGGLQGTAFARYARRDQKIASAMSIPLQVKDKTLGVLNVNRFKGQPTYTEKDASLLHIFTAQIAIALQNAQLYASLRQERDRIMEAQEVVRRELARDLHDGLSQMLAAMAVNIGVLQTILKPGEKVPDAITDDLDYLHNAVRQAIQDARTLTFGLRPLVLETQGIVAAMKQYIATLQKSDRRTDYILVADQMPRIFLMPVNDARMVFAIIQEAINNARKHAKAPTIEVTLVPGTEPQDPLLTATIRDNGTGFDVAAITADYEERLSFGLNTMRERAELIDATLHVASSRDGGTVIQLVLPRKL